MHSLLRKIGKRFLDSLHSCKCTNDIEEADRKAAGVLDSLLSGQTITKTDRNAKEA